MGKNLDGLINHLVDEIALTGDYGTSPSDFISQVKVYYLDESTIDSKPKNDLAESEKQNIPNIDKPFLEYIWTCLVQNAEISTGEHRQYRDLTLAEAEASCEAKRSLDNNVTNGDTPQLATDSESGKSQRQFGRGDEGNERSLITVEAQFPITPITSEHDTIEHFSAPSHFPNDNSLSSAANNTNSQQAVVERLDAKADEASVNSGVRLFASENRMWHALTGHEPDSSRLKELDFVLLSIIASYGSKGILQHDLVRASGQDKRSLPHRTDRLHEYGYIEKKKISTLLWEGTYARKLHTSLCTLKRLVQNPQHDEEIRRLVGEVKAKKTKKRKGKKFANKKLPPIYGADDEDLNHEVNSEADDVHSAQTPEERVEDLGQAMQKTEWTPDRCTTNQIFNLVEISGTKGATIPEIRERLFGDDYKKPTESILSRLVDAWQVSQPLHLRHLAIVRDTVLQGKSPVYIHYTYGNFKRLVDSGRATWTAVTTIATPRSKKGSQAALLGLDSQPDNDEFGFPILDAADFQGKDLDATLADCASTIPPVSSSGHRMKPYNFRYPEHEFSSKKDIRQSHNINSSVPRSHQSRAALERSDPGRARRRSSLNSESSVAEELETPRKPANTVKRGVGRPRKYPKPGLPVDMEGMTRETLSELKRSRVKAGKYQKSKIITEIQRRIALGIAAQEAAKEVLQETEDTIRTGSKECLYPNIREEILYKFGNGTSPRSSEFDPAIASRQNSHVSKWRKEDQRRGQPRPQELPYYPSVAAHTFFVPCDPATHVAYQKLENSTDNVDPLEKGTRKRKIKMPSELLLTENNVRKRGRPRTQKLPYYPSLAAHTFFIPHNHTPHRAYNKIKQFTGHTKSTDKGTKKREIDLSSGFLPTDKIVRRRGRPKKRTIPYYPSTAAHTFFVPHNPTPLRVHHESKQPADNAIPVDKGTRKRKLNHSEDLLLTNMNSTKRQKAKNDSGQPGWDMESHETSGKSSYTNRNSNAQSVAINKASIITRAAQGRLRLPEMMSKRYTEQLRNVIRPHDGFFTGESLILRRRKGEAHLEQPITYKVAVFKLKLLKSVAWFATSQPLSKLDSLENLQHRHLTSNIKTSIYSSIYDQPESCSEDAITSPKSPPQDPSAQELPELGSIEISQGEKSFAVESGPATAIEVRHASPTRALYPISASASTSPSPNTTAQLEHVHASSNNAGTVGKGMRKQKSSHLLDRNLVSTNTSRVSASPSVLEQNKGLSSSNSLMNGKIQVRQPWDPGHVASLTKNRNGLLAENGIYGHVEALMQVPPCTLSQDTMSSKNDQSTCCPESGRPKSRRSVTESPANNNEAQLLRRWKDAEIHHHCSHSPQQIETTSTDNQLTSIIQLDESQSEPSAENPNPMRKIQAFWQETDARPRKLDETFWMTFKIRGPLLQRISKPALTDARALNQAGDSVLLERVHEHGQHKHFSAPQLLSRQPPETNRNNEKVSFLGINRRGGSTAILRGDIILDLVRKCGGVSPGFTALTIPFGVEWTRRGQPGRPERVTVRTAANNLCNTGRLRQLTFAYQTKEGLTKTSSLYTLPEIDPTDSKVKKMQDEIKNYHPRFYVPKEWLITNEDQAAASGQIGSSAGDGSTNLRITEAFSRLDYHKQLLRSSEKVNEDKSAKLRKILEKERLRADEAIYGRETFGNITGPKRVVRKRNIPKPTALGSQKAVSHGQGVGLLGIFGDFILQNPATTKWQSMKPPALRAVWRKYYTIRKNPIKGRHRPMYSLSKPMQPSYDTEFRVVPQIARPHDSILQQRSKVSWVGGDITDLDMSMTTDDEDESSASASSPEGISSPPAPRYRPLLPKVSILPQRPIRSLTKEKPARMPSYMNPKQFFHPSSGTFSTNFSGAPSSLVKITRFRVNLRRSIPKEKIPRPSKSAFELEVDKVERDELELPNFQNIILPNWTFISHKLPHPHEYVQIGSVEMDRGKIYVSNSKTGRIGAKTMAKILDIEPTSSTRVTRSGASMTPRKYFRFLEDSPNRKTPKLKRKRRRTASVSGDFDLHGYEELQHSEGPRPQKLRRIKGPQDFRSLTEEEEQRLVTAVVVIRCLTGGIEKRIDWSLVAIVFEPKRDREFIRLRWNHTRHKYKFSLKKAESDFQEHFIRAYKEDNIPPINFGNLRCYPWKWLIQWAMDQNAAPLQSLPDLDLNSPNLLNDYRLDTVTEIDMNRFYDINSVGVTHTREALINQYPWTYSLSSNVFASIEEDSDLAIAKTWIRANVATPHENYDPDMARATLLTFPEETIEAALQDLLDVKLLIQDHKRRLVPGRNYDLHEPTFARLQKNIPVSAFYRAASFKAHIDAELALNGSLEYSPHAKDGDVIAVLNMLSSGRVTLQTKDVPMNKMGHTDGGYETRQMDKSRLFCNVAILPLPAYVSGNPLLPLPPPPAKHLPPTSSARTPGVVEKQKIPLWYDIHGQLIQPLWELALAAVMAVLVTRPGIGVREVEQAVRPCMGEWEIEWVLEWIVTAGVATARGEGNRRRWITGEWWWLVLGGGDVVRELEGW